jgi:hypothetical protein
MSDSLPILLENSIQIAWDYLERTGEIDDGAVASQFLAGTIEHIIRSGERRRLILSNRAPPISASDGNPRLRR